GNGGGTRTNATTGSASGSLYVMNVGLDMRLVNTNTLEVADVISYQKQIIGRQISAGVFDFLGTNFFDISVGESALEPIQLAVRSVIERATLEMITRIYRAPDAACAIPLGTNDDPLRDGSDRPMAYAPTPYAPAPSAPQPAYYAPPPYQTSTSEAGRGSPYRGYYDGEPRLRGGL
ncbi:MAG TPA: CsgG/HfaB family protein, partial [Rhizomicrobium sp.]|nr:CsgG/HfaB family protein [Rhizomicrobium sp.]